MMLPNADHQSCVLHDLANMGPGFQAQVQCFTEATSLASRCFPYRSSNMDEATPELA